MAFVDKFKMIGDVSPSYNVGRFIDVAPPDCVLWLPLYMLPGASFVSRDAYGHLATVMGATWGPEGRTFDGIDDYINAGAAASLDITDAITLEIWIKLLAIPTGFGPDAIGKATDYTGYALEVALTSGNIAGRFGGSAPAWGYTNAYTLILNQWTHVVGTRDASYLRLFVDGAEVGSPVATLYSMASNAASVLMGKHYSQASFLNAVIGEARIYNRTLSVLEIQREYIEAKRRMPWLVGA